MMKILLLTVMCLTVTLSDVLAQERTVTGRVTSAEDGSPLPGVNIVVKGTIRGTVTDNDGMYTLPVPSSGATLVFSFIGLITQEVEIGERTTIDILMQQDVAQLGEVVITALGIPKEKRSVGYSITNVDSKTLNQGT